MYIKENQKVKSIIEEREIFIFPAFFLVRVSRKETLKEFETAINMAPDFFIFYSFT